MHLLTKLIQEDMRLALGVTEPGAIAFAVAKARSYTAGEITGISLKMNSGLYKNAFTCGIPNSYEVGPVFAAALGAVAGRAELGLESLSKVMESDRQAAQTLVEQGRITIQCGEITSRIFLEVQLDTPSDTCCVTIQDSHTNIVSITRNGEKIFTAEPPVPEKEEPEDEFDFSACRLSDFLEYCETVPASELQFLREAYETNLTLFEEGMADPRTIFLKSFLRSNGGKRISDNEELTAQLLCSGAIEARVTGVSKPAMSITGSGAHGIICTLPLYAVQQIRGLPEERLLRATALSYLITMNIKAYSGKLSAFCGCAIAAGSGMACALAWMEGASPAQIEAVLLNMSSSITGMICDGGNQGCTMKSVTAVATAFHAVHLALDGVCVAPVHGINGFTPEETFRNMGQIAVPGMVATEGTILDILKRKNDKASGR